MHDQESLSRIAGISREPARNLLIALLDGVELGFVEQDVFEQELRNELYRESLDRLPVRSDTEVSQSPVRSMNLERDDLSIDLSLSCVTLEEEVTQSGGRGDRSPTHVVLEQRALAASLMANPFFPTRVTQSAAFEKLTGKSGRTFLRHARAIREGRPLRRQR